MREDQDSDEMREENDEHLRHRQVHWMKHWMRHTAMVPKGFLRYKLLNKLNEKPMSGSEIMSELESETNGYWKPSPGSIYPLLAWLQDQRYIKETDETEPGIRRYALTDQGKAFLQSETQSREEINKRLEQFGPMWWGSERNVELRKSTRSLIKAVRDLSRELRREYAKETVEETVKVLDATTEHIQEITRKLHQ